MSVVPASNLAGALSASQLAQTGGAETDRVKQETSSHDGKVQSNRQAESAAGIGETKEQEGAGDRDADGRRLWELNEERSEQTDQEPPPPQQSKDPTGRLGGRLDLSG